MLFLPGVDASQSCLRACLGARLLLPSQTFWRALTASVDSCVEITSASIFSGVLNLGRVWKKVPESESRSVVRTTSSGEQASVTAWMSPVEVPPNTQALRVGPAAKSHYGSYLGLIA